MRLSRPASAVHTVFCSVVPWLVKGLRCSRADPTCSLSHAPLRAARVEGVDFRLVVNSAMPCLRPLLRVAGNTSLLEPQPRRSAHCSFRRALLSSVSRDHPRWSFLPSRPCAGGHPMSPLCTSLLSLSTCVWGDRGSLPWSGFPLLRPPGCSPAEAQSLRLFAAVAAAAVCLVVSGHFSTQTCSN